MRSLLLAALLLPLSLACLAETPEEKGLAIAREADRRDSGWNDQTADMEMILRNRQGDESLTSSIPRGTSRAPLPFSASPTP